MCSLGKVKPFFGDVMPSPAMKSCLEARSYKKEVVLLTESRLNPAYQTFRSLLDLGYEHAVLLSTLERCVRSNATWPRLGCVWSTQPLLSQMRYLMDRINCGVVYIRNARPDGPAAYVLAEVLDRLERWADNPGYFSGRGLNGWCWDQQMYSDAFLSTLAGRPVSYSCWLKYEPPSLKAEWDESHVRLFGGRPGRPFEHQDYLRDVPAPWPAELLTEAPDYPHKRVETIWMATMRVPNARGDWPMELGGAVYPPQRGETSRIWREILEADGVPLWPDPEDPTKADLAATITETFAYLPIYLSESWSQGGALGYWNPALLRPTGQPPAALAHFVHVPGGATNKLTVKMAFNHWDWDVAHAAHPNRGVFFASTRAAPLPDVLALDPRLVAGGKWSQEGDFAAVVLALLRLALEMGRAVAYPAPPCNASWLGGEANNRLPLVVHHERNAAEPGGVPTGGFHIPYSPRGKGFKDLRCLWGGYLPFGCQASRWYFPGGLLAPEYDHLLDIIRRDSAGLAAARQSAEHLSQLGFSTRAEDLLASPGFGGGVSSGSGFSVDFQGGGGDVVTVPRELLQPPAAAAAWDVTRLAAALMDKYGGPGSGLQANVADLAAAATADVDSATTAAAAAATTASSGRPRVLVLPEVPRLTEVLGPRHELFKRELATGPDRNVMSCDWILTGRPYRRRLLQQQQQQGSAMAQAMAAWRLGELLEAEEVEADEA
ncbi:hypothetical protein VOLCADRAFT_88492 [Volvox carteri f. nagariensis]|uniref:Uncharacterized protein n=1 Tax=Volvox carteri f. nagariensis TaxID=3068 RepID=D8TP52_VOLCA|nr:uncharacterized protein VOLCADRAFT_88492 [Volvox carteri f. nagariensis]EFJ50559.1 hypothetical protein VOLCADRAFT_88492 [Volvox carteri f. nagariensis]|eukprot:XP_002948152.1 hypothetical protein VOLCADRAFT_88492 [Volvox carteri f. nagariensis]